MRRLFVGNFDFEHRLAIPAQQVPQTVERINKELASAWLAVAADDDLIWLTGEIERGFCDKLGSPNLPRVRFVDDPGEVGGDVELWAWGWTAGLRKWAEERNWSFAAADASAIRSVNSRQFSFAIEREWVCGPAGCATLRSLDDVLQAVHDLPAASKRWVIKAEFGMSARERILGAGEPDDKQQNWIARRLQADGCVFFEPWLERHSEAGLQFTILEQGPPVLEGITPLLSAADGAYRGSRFHDDESDDDKWREALEVGRKVAERAQQAGYFGPLGIDACRYIDADGVVQMRPIQDVNGRYTMGRLSLGFRRLLQAGERGSWLHVRLPTDSLDAPRRHFERIVKKLPRGTQAIRTSPLVIDNRPVGHGALVVIAPDDETLRAAESCCLD